MSATDKREDSTGGSGPQKPQPPAFSFLAPTLSKTQQLRNLGGLRDADDIGMDKDRAGWLMSPAYMALPYILEPNKSENRLANAALNSELGAEQLAEQAKQPMPQIQKSALMQKASGLRNEAMSYARLDSDIRNNDDKVEAFPQIKVNTETSFRQPDAAIAPFRDPQKGVILREMKTRSLDERSVGQLSDLVGQMKQPRASLEIQGKALEAPIMGLEIEMRSSSKDLPADTLKFIGDLAAQTDKPVRMRSQSMTEFRPVEDVVQRQQVHQIK